MQCNLPGNEIRIQLLNGLRAVLVIFQDRLLQILTFENTNNCRTSSRTADISRFSCLSDCSIIVKIELLFDIFFNVQNSETYFTPKQVSFKFYYNLTGQFDTTFEVHIGGSNTVEISLYQLVNFAPKLEPISTTNYSHSMKLIASHRFVSLMIISIMILFRRLSKLCVYIQLELIHDFIHCKLGCKLYLS